jgi:pyruvate dehydrogenase E2 component (dihydrolipoamide acetyltransferase)
MTDLMMPSYGISDAGGVLIKWLKKAGDIVEKGEALVEIETEKARTELESPCDGILAKVFVAEGEQVETGKKLGVINESLKDDNDRSNIESSSASIELSTKTKGTKDRTQYPVDLQDNSVGILSQDTSVKASPGARRYAAKFGVDIGLIRGTGPKGRIVEEDVKTFYQSQIVTRETRSLMGQRFEALTPTRRSIANRMLHSIRSIPHFHLTVDVDATCIQALRRDKAAHKPSVTAVVLRVLADTLTRWPRLNSSWENDQIEIHEGIHINVAVATDRGLLAPVIRNVPSKTIEEIDGQLRDLAAIAREGRATPEDLSQGTFTFTNLGMYGVRQFDPIINPPQCSILAVGTMREQPFASNGLIGVRPEMTLTLAVDHRIVDGSEAAQFLSDLRLRLENLAHTH